MLFLPICRHVEVWYLLRLWKNDNLPEQICTPLPWRLQKGHFFGFFVRKTEIRLPSVPDEANNQTDPAVSIYEWKTLKRAE